VDQDRTRTIMPDSLELPSDDDVRVLRAMSPAQRLWAANRMVVQLREVLRFQLRTQHPAWSQESIDAAVLERMGHDSVA
jgi:hypothetical protein